MTADDYIKSLAKFFVPASYQEIIRALEYEDLTVVQLSNRIKANRTTVHKAMEKLSEWHLVHVCDWQPPKGSGQWLRIYRIGKGANKRRPPIKPISEICRDYKMRHADPPELGMWGY